jgi:UDP-GlcNAc:undecaprenyl-phosphate GlcNAc-1-phosphate transferase
VIKLQAIILVLSVTIGFSLTLLVRWGARKLGVVDVPDDFRKLQERPIPRMGGVAVFVAFFAALLVGTQIYRSADFAEFLHGPGFLTLLGGATAVLLIGLCDDIWDVRARWKFVALCLVAGAMYVAGYRIGAVSNPFGGAINLGLWGVPVTLFWFLGCMNAINLIDGMDGLAGGVAVFAAAVVFVASMLLGNATAALLSIALAGAVLGFLLLNFPPASIFLGDSGSYLLGFLLACIGLRGSQKSNMVVALAIPVIALGLPVIDTTLAILRRWASSLPLGASDRQHIHHKLLDLGLSNRKAVLVMYTGCLVLGGFALLLTAADNVQAAVVLGALGICTFLAVRVIGRTEFALAKNRGIQYFQQRRRDAECRTAGHRALERMQHAQQAAAFWEVFCEAAEELRLDRASMTIRRLPASPQEVPRSFTWHGHGGNNGYDDADCPLWSASFPLVNDEKWFGVLRVAKATNGLPLDPSVPEMLELLRSGLTENLARVGTRPTPLAPPAGMADLSRWSATVS